MLLQLHQLCIRLNSEDTAVNKGWQDLFAGWLISEDSPVDLQFTLHECQMLPDLPTTKPIFMEEPESGADVGMMTVYSTGNGRVLLHYHDGALIEVSLLATDDFQITGFITPAALANGRLEDITFTSLAPGLRQREIYLVHAFAASKNGRALLLVGETGSGKTTTGLNLLLNGWRLLANDIVFLQKQDGTIFALATPGTINIRPETFKQLPKLQRLLPDNNLPKQSVAVSGQTLIQGKWSAPARVNWLCFPQISPRPVSTLSPQNRGLALVKLMEESVDRWDAITLPDHIAFLEILCRQTAVYDLLLGQDFADLPGHLEEELL